MSYDLHPRECPFLPGVSKAELERRSIAEFGRIPLADIEPRDERERLLLACYARYMHKTTCVEEALAFVINYARNTEQRDSELTEMLESIEDEDLFVGSL